MKLGKFTFNFHNNWKDDKGYWAFILFGFYNLDPQYIIIICNFSFVIER